MRLQPPFAMLQNWSHDDGCIPGPWMLYCTAFFAALGMSNKGHFFSSVSSGWLASRCSLHSIPFQPDALTVLDMTVQQGAYRTRDMLRAQEVATRSSPTRYADTGCASQASSLSITVALTIQCSQQRRSFNTQFIVRWPHECVRLAIRSHRFALACEGTLELANVQLETIVVVAGPSAGPSKVWLHVRHWYPARTMLRT